MIYTLQQIRDGTGFARGARFVELREYDELIDWLAKGAQLADQQWRGDIDQPLPRAWAWYRDRVSALLDRIAEERGEEIKRWRSMTT